MLHTFRSNHFQSAALIIIAAFFSLAACKNKAATPEWEQSQAEGTEQDAATITAQAADDKQAENGNTNKEPATAEKSNKPVRFLAYNLKNYLTMGRYINGKRVQASKPEEEIAPLIKLIVEAKPDVLGVCEIGSDADLADLQKRLKTAGIDLPHTHRAHGSDSVRALAILSRYPITATAKPAETGYKLGDIDFHISRGVLDATIKLPNREVRFLGCHLKSKRPIKEADQELMRRNESSILRKHINTILEKKPDTEMLVYGDFNDTKRTPALRTAMGRLNSSKGLIVINAVDSRGESWTHHWTREDIYSRFDFAMVSKKLAPHIDKENSILLDPDYWEKASDHRAILVLIK